MGGEGPQDTLSKPKQRDPFKVRYFYLRDPKKFPVACVASKLASGSPSIIYALSIVNPLDRNNFKRATARRIASQRLDEQKLVGGKSKGCADHPFATALPAEEKAIKRSLVGAIVDNTALVRRVREAAADWLIDDALRSVRPKDDPEVK